MTVVTSAPLSAQSNVRWLAPAECPQAGDFVSALRAQLPDPSARELVDDVDARITRAARGKRAYRLQLELEVKGQSARRVLAAEACAELLNAAVWLVVLAVGPAGLPGAVEPSPTQSAAADEASTIKASAQEASSRSSGADATAQRPTGGRSTRETKVETAERRDNHTDETATSEPVAREDADEPPTPKEIHARIAAFGGVSFGAGVKAQGVVGLWADVSVNALHTQVAISDLLPMTESAPGGGHVQVWSLALGLSECALWGKRVFAGPCAGIEGLRTAAHSKDFGRETNRSVLWVAVHAGLQLLWPLTRSLELNLAGNVAVPVTPRPRFTVAGLGEVASAQRFSEEAHLGLIYRAY